MTIVRLTYSDTRFEMQSIPLAFFLKNAFYIAYYNRERRTVIQLKNDYGVLVS